MLSQAVPVLLQMHGGPRYAPLPGAGGCAGGQQQQQQQELWVGPEQSISPVGGGSGGGSGAQVAVAAPGGELGVHTALGLGLGLGPALDMNGGQPMLPSASDSSLGAGVSPGGAGRWTDEVRYFSSTRQHPTAPDST
jgi:hypothetical protein